MALRTLRSCADWAAFPDIRDDSRDRAFYRLHAAPPFCAEAGYRLTVVVGAGQMAVGGLSIRFEALRLQRRPCGGRPGRRALFCYGSAGMPGFAAWASRWWMPLLFIVIAGHVTN